MRVLCKQGSREEDKGGGERSDSLSKHHDVLFVVSEKEVSGPG